jgi:hypothetical protein
MLQQRKEGGVFGHHLRKKDCNSIRVLFQNIGGLGDLFKDKEPEKLSRLKTFLIKQDVDVLGIAETNTDWRTLPLENNLWNRTSSWFQSRRISVSHNDKVAPKSGRYFQVGGTATMLINEMASRPLKPGADVKGYGRWSWIVLTGKDSRVTRFVTAYCPCKSINTSGAYSQQLLALSLDNQPDQCPRKVFWDDLSLCIDMWLQKGEQLVIMGDWNSDDVSTRQWFHNKGLVDPHFDAHGPDLPPTYQRSSQGPIDGIYISPGLTASRSGYLAFGKLAGDHRAIWIDIPRMSIFGFKKHMIQPKIGRRLTVKNPVVVKRYNRHLTRYCHRNNLFRRMAVLRQTAGPTVNRKWATEYEQVDSLIRQGQELAEQKCRRICLGGVPWSPRYKIVYDTVKYWTMMKKLISGDYVDFRKLLQLRETYDFQDTRSPAIIRHKLNDAHAQRKEVKANAEAHSYEYRTRLADHMATEGNTTREQHLRNLNRNEASRRLHRRVRYITGKGTTGSTTFVTVQKQGQITEITERKELERAIITENLIKYHQTEDACPLLQDDMLELIGTLGDGPAVANVLEGNLESFQGVNENTLTFLRLMKRQEPPPAPLPSITLKDFIQSWKIKNEHTSSMGSHFGHYQAATRDELLACLLWLKMELPMLTGYSPMHHRQGTDCMILKKANSFDISLLRTIVLMDAEFNHMNSVIGRLAMHRAIDTGQLAREQYSRPGRTAAAHALNRRLIFDTQLTKRIPYSLAMSDLKSCYDRVVHAAVSLAFQRIGIPITVIVSMFDSIQRMVHRVRTAFGDSDDTYGGDEIDDGFQAPPQGFNQGSGVGPPGWSILSSIILAALRDAGYGISFINAITHEAYQLAALAFVDDSDLIQSGETVELAHTLMVASMKFWEDMIKETGGCLAPDKSKWYLIDYVWKHGKFRCSDPMMDADLTATTKTGEVVSLQRLLATESMEMLGIWMCPDGNNKAQIQAMRTKTNEWADKVRTRYITKEEARVSIQISLRSSLQYPLPTLTLQEHECRYIMAPVVTFGLPRTGLPKSLPRAIREAPTSVGGTSFPSLYHMQGCARIEALVEHIRLKSPTYYILNSLVDSLRLEAGLDFQLFSRHGFHEYQWMTFGWVSECLRYAAQNDIILSDVGTQLHPQRTNDRSLMQLVLENQNFSISNIKAINRCRMALHVYWMSDIMDATGTTLQPGVWHNSRSRPIIRSNSFQWPTRYHTNKNDWSIWRSALKAICTSTGYHPKINLGRWLIPTPLYLSEWTWFVTQSFSHLYQNLNGVWYRYDRHPGRLRRHQHQFRLITKTECTCPDTPLICRTDIINQTEDILCVSNGFPCSQVTTQIDLALPIEKTLTRRTLPTTRHWILSHIARSSKISRLLQDFQQGTTRVCSDGSFYPHSGQGAAAWRIESSCGTQFIEGGGQVPGERLDMCSYRTELGGLIGSSLAIKGLETTVDTTTHITVGCDSLSALEKCGTPLDLIKPAHKHFDLQGQLSHIESRTKSTKTFVHVYAHQDSDGSDTALTPMALLNTKVDILAKQMIHQAPPPTIIELGFPTVTCGGRRVSSRIKSSLYNHITTREFLAYLTSTGKLAEGANSFIHWTALRTAKRESSSFINNMIAKWTCNQMPTALVQSRWGTVASPICPRCKTTVETSNHIARCHKAQPTWSESLNLLHSWMSTQFTDPELQHMILTGLQVWTEGRRRDITSFHNPRITLLYYQQVDIGWSMLLMGFVSTHIVDWQDSYYSTIGSRRSGSRWAANLIKQIWKMLSSSWHDRNQDIFSSVKDPTGSHACLLRTAIQEEHSRGRDRLSHHYAPYFAHPVRFLLSKSIYQQQQWYRIIKTARVATASDVPNIFTYDSELRRWIGLEFRSMDFAPVDG